MAREATFPGPVFGDVLESIGNTPLMEVRRLDTGPCRLFLKLENQNPGGSIKDRIGKSMIEAAEADGRLKPGGTLIEATAGNTGLGPFWGFLLLLTRARIPSTIAPTLGDANTSPQIAADNIS